MSAKRKGLMWIGIANFLKIPMKALFLSSNAQPNLPFGPFGIETAVKYERGENIEALKAGNKLLAFEYTNRKG